MNDNKVKIEITCTDGKTETVESNAVYGCAMNEEDEGVRCKSFFTGSIRPIFMGKPMAASVINVVETLCKDYPGLGVYVLKDVFDAIGDKITELASDTETGDDHGGN